MAKAIITICDESDGRLNINVKFDPPASKDSDVSDAHHLAVRVIKFIASQHEDGEGDDE